MHVDLRLRQGAFDQQAEAAQQRLALRCGQLATQVPADIPVGKELHLAPQQRFVVGRQLARLRGELPADQGLGGVAEKPRRVLRVELVQVGARAEVGEEEEALRQILREDLGGVHAGLAQQACHVHEGPAILLVRRRGHRDDRAALGIAHAEVAAEARVLGSGGQAEAIVAGFQPQVRGQPALEGSAPCIGVYH